ncbi:DUF4954 family protein [Segetibacter sp. 3557_3]|nr:DUF4954 family protein [Segetibacter sp. 3557_3]
MGAATNIIKKNSMASLGYNFVAPHYIPKGKDEYYLRNAQNLNGVNHRQLSAFEIEVLVRNRNTSDNWNNILVSDAFNPELVKNCKFFGLVRIGKLEQFCLEFSDLKVPVGLYNSTIISCDFGDNVVIDNVNYLSHYIIGSEVIVVNVNELVTTDFAKFGNGLVKDGEEESLRIWLELCNENGGRKIIPFDGMLAGDAYLWTKYRDDLPLLEKFKQFTEAKGDKRRGYYGKIGDRTVIKNCKIIKDVMIGSDAYLKGANKLKNLTINSGPEGKSQIGEGCEMVNGIVGYGCRAFYGVKAVRFIMASHSQLKYGARLINSYLGNNSTISCCEVLNSLIFPAHEQHHNNSFLCASMVMGQSNIAAGATIGSNHNSRSADGELVAGRGFWPGLCVSLKHNSKFASYTIISKGDYPAELCVPFPFALVSNNISRDELVLMPCYWFAYNMYALARNERKYIDRDKRIDRKQLIEYDYLAPDSINEIFIALEKLKLYTGRAFLKRTSPDESFSDAEKITAGEQLLLAKDPVIDELEIVAHGVENSKRKVLIIKVQQAYDIYCQLVVVYACNQLLDFADQHENFESMLAGIPAKISREAWANIGGQLIPANEVEQLKKNIRSGKVKSWDMVHEFYGKQGSAYPMQKLLHSVAALLELKRTKKLSKELLMVSLDEFLVTKEWMTKNIYRSRAKDYTNEFRKMVYENDEEMNAVVGKLEDNSFIKEQQAELKLLRKRVEMLRAKMFATNVKGNKEKLVAAG